MNTVLQLPGKSFVQELIERTNAPILDEYKRSDLKKLIDHKYWRLIEPLGEPCINGDADIEALNANRASSIIRYAASKLFSDKLENREKLQQMILREQDLAELFGQISILRQSVLNVVAAKEAPPTKIDPVEVYIHRLKSLGPWEQVKRIDDGSYIGLRSIKGRGHELVTDLSELNYGSSYIYPNLKFAEKVFKEWDGHGEPPSLKGWVMVLSADEDHPRFECK